MRSFKGLKLLFCLVFTFIFMFGNVLFVKASAIEVEETAELETKYECNGDIIYFIGMITYTCSDPYQDKKIVSVDNISLGMGYSGLCDTVDFEQQYVDYVNVSEDGKKVTADVCGKLILHPYQADEDVYYVQYARIPVFFAINK